MASSGREEPKSHGFSPFSRSCLPPLLCSTRVPQCGYVT
ncbi:hypothetical protein ACP70R_039292 [Stipagrostis hirtigluma subsp. patula]